MKKQSFNLQSNSTMILVASLIILSFFIGYLFFKVQSLEKGSNTQTATSQGNSAQPQAPSQPVNIKDVKLEGHPYIGNKDAPVTMAYWLDYQCPFCKRFETDTLPILVDKYIKAGKLRIVFKDYQFLGPDSQTAGMAAKAIWELYPDKYFAWHQAMYKAQDEENGGAFGSKGSIIALVRTISGIDADRISALMDQKKDQYLKELEEDQKEGTKFGVNGTPGFVIGTQSVSGAQPSSIFTQIIDNELSKAGK